MLPTSSFSKSSFLESSKSFDIVALLETTTFCLNSLNLTILNSYSLLRYSSKFGEGLISTCEPGKNAFTTPKSTTNPPFIILTIVPFSKVSFSAASLNSDHLFSKSALLLDNINLPFLSSNTTKKTSISAPISGILSNSVLSIIPSDLNPISTTTSLS